MKKTGVLILVAIIFTSCVKAPVSHKDYGYISREPVKESLFDDKDATISEENIQKILSGSYSLPDNLRVAFVQLAIAKNLRGYGSDEQYLKSKQQHSDLLSENFKRSPRVKMVSTIPDILIAKNPTFTNIRESAVRTQSDLVVIYAINCDIYSRYRPFVRMNAKVFATTQLIILDVKTGLIPFTTIVTKEFQDKKNGDDLNENDAIARIMNQAVLLTIEEVGKQITEFLNNGKQ